VQNVNQKQANNLQIIKKQLKEMVI